MHSPPVLFLDSLFYFRPRFFSFTGLPTQQLAFFLSFFFKNVSPVSAGAAVLTTILQEAKDKNE